MNTKKFRLIRQLFEEVSRILKIDWFANFVLENEDPEYIRRPIRMHSINYMIIIDRKKVGSWLSSILENAEENHN